MNTIPDSQFPPPGSIVIERTERRAVLLHGASSRTGITIAVWTRMVVSVRPSTLGGWLCSPDAGLSLSNESARALMIALGEALR